MMAASGREVRVGSKLSLVTLACSVHYLNNQHPPHHIATRKPSINLVTYGINKSHLTV